MKKSGILADLNYRAGLLNDSMPATDETAPVELTPEVIEETTGSVSGASENILPAEYVETESLLNGIEEGAAFIEEELENVADEQTLVTDGLQSDFTKVTTALMQKSIARINEKFPGAIGVAGLQSDKFSGHKALYTHGLQAKENFLKSQLEAFGKLLDQIIEKIKTYVNKIMVTLNQDAKESDRLLGLISGLEKQKAVQKDGAEISEAMYNNLASKFGAFLAIGGKFEDYETIVAGDLLSINPVPKAISANELEIESADSIRKLIADSSLFSTVGVGKDDFWPVFIAGKTIRIIAAETAAEGAADQVVINGKKYTNISYDTIATNDKDAITKAKAITAIPSLQALRGMTETAKSSAGGLKTFASNAWSRVDGYKKIINEAKKENGPGLSDAIAKQLPSITPRIANDAVTMYTATQKSLNSVASMFITLYTVPTK